MNTFYGNSMFRKVIYRPVGNDLKLYFSSIKHIVFKSVMPRHTGDEHNMV